MRTGVSGFAGELLYTRVFLLLHVSTYAIQMYSYYYICVLILPDPQNCVHLMRATTVVQLQRPLCSAVVLYPCRIHTPSSLQPARTSSFSPHALVASARPH